MKFSVWGLILQSNASLSVSQNQLKVQAAASGVLPGIEAIAFRNDLVNVSITNGQGMFFDSNVIAINVGNNLHVSATVSAIFITSLANMALVLETANSKLSVAQNTIFFSCNGGPLIYDTKLRCSSTRTTSELSSPVGLLASC